MPIFKKIANQVEASTSEGNKDQPALITVKDLRTMVGIMGMVLAFFLVLGNVLVGDCHELQPSISHYYYTNMRDFFVGTMFGVSVFLFCYKGNNKWDNRASMTAAVFAFITAVLPTNLDTQFKCQHEVPIFIDFPMRSYVHLGSAGMFLLVLALMSIILFTKSKHPKDQLPERKKIRNRIYYFCGYTMIFCLLVLFVYFIISGVNSQGSYPVALILEAVSLIAFGISWLTKAEVFFPDKM